MNVTLELGPLRAKSIRVFSIWLCQTQSFDQISGKKHNPLASVEWVLRDAKYLICYAPRSTWDLSKNQSREEVLLEQALDLFLRQIHSFIWRSCSGLRKASDLPSHWRKIYLSLLGKMYVETCGERPGGPGFACSDNWKAKDGGEEQGDDLFYVTRVYGDLCPQRASLVEDGAPAHRSKVAKLARADLGIQTLDHPPSSPDLNPIENCWCFLKAKIGAMERTATTLDELWEQAVEAWEAIGQEQIRDLIDEMEHRREAVKKAKGGSTKY